MCIRAGHRCSRWAGVSGSSRLRGHQDAGSGAPHSPGSHGTGGALSGAGRRGTLTSVTLPVGGRPALSWWTSTARARSKPVTSDGRRPPIREANQPGGQLWMTLAQAALDGLGSGSSGWPWHRQLWMALARAALDGLGSGSSGWLWLGQLWMALARAALAAALETVRTSTATFVWSSSDASRPMASARSFPTSPQCAGTTRPSPLTLCRTS